MRSVMALIDNANELTFVIPYRIGGQKTTAQNVKNASQECSTVLSKKILKARNTDRKNMIAWKMQESQTQFFPAAKCCQKSR